MKSSILAFLSFLVLQTVSAQRDTPDEISTKTGTLTIQPLVHASLVLSFKDLTIYVDPTGGAKNYSGIKPPDLILITDIHGDHFDPKTLSDVRTASTTIIAPKAVADKMPDSMKTKLVILNNGDNSTQSGIGISALPMYNLPESPNAMHTKGRGNGYVLNLESSGSRILLRRGGKSARISSP